MLRKNLFGVLLLGVLVACGGVDEWGRSGVAHVSSATESDADLNTSWARVAGDIRGETSQFSVAYAAPVDASDARYGLALVLSDDPNVCADGTVTKADHSYVVVYLMGAPLAGTQTFWVSRPGAGQAMAALLRVGNDRAPERLDAVDGRVTLTGVEHGIYSGTVTLRMDHGGAVAGKFRAPTCAQLDAATL